MELLDLNKVNRTKLPMEDEVIKVKTTTNLETIGSLNLIYLLESNKVIEDVENNNMLILEQNKIYKAIKYLHKNNNGFVKRLISNEGDKSLEINDDNYLLSVGSIVLVDNVKLLIISRGVELDGKKIEYVGCKIPLGMVDDEKVYFSHKDIEKLFSFPQDDKESIEYTLKIKSWLEDN